MHPRRNLTLLAGMALLQGMVFYSPVATLYRVQFGLPLSQFFIIEALSWGLTMLSELPWGLVADRIGYKRTLVWGYGLLVATKVIFALADGFGGFLAERLLLALAIGAISGCDAALVHQSAPSGGSARAFARLRASGLAGLIVASLASPFLAAWSLRATAWATVPPYALAWILSWFLVAPARAALAAPAAPVAPMAPTGPQQPRIRRHPLRIRRRLVMAASRLFGRGLRWPLALAALALMAELAHLVVIFLSQLQYQRAGIPQGAFGLLFLVLHGLPMAVLALLPASFGRRPQRSLAWSGVLASAAVAVLFLQANPLVSVAALADLATVAQVQGSLNAAWQNASIRNNAGRAAALSVYALWGEGVAAAGNGLLGSLSAAGLLPALGTAAVLMALATLCLVVWPVRHESGLGK